MNKLQSQTRGLQRFWHVLRLLLALIVVLVVLVLLGERWRGQWALKTWKEGMAARDEVFEPTKFWPPISARSREFSNDLALAVGGRSGRLGHYAGELEGMVMEQPGVCRRGSQEPSPPLSANSSTNSWKELDELLKQHGPMLLSLRELMKDPPPGIGYNAIRNLESNSFPNFVAIRISAQSLHAAAINDLHKNDLTAASRDLVALLAFAKLYEKDPTLVNYMIRMAIVGLSVDVCWDALQAEGWTEPQLAALQRACADNDRLLSQMPRTLEAERVSRIYDLSWFRTHTYEAWIARNEGVFASFGVKPPASDVGDGVRNTRQYLFHPVWSFAWAPREELDFLRTQQAEVMALRDAVKHRSLLKLKEQLSANRLAYRALVAAWRFYRKVPLVDTFGDAFGGSKGPDSGYPYPDRARAWHTAMKNLTLHEMVKTAIALKRYELKHGKAPSELAALIPDFLPSLPCDFMDGQPLRYRSNPDGSFTLYSVGEDMRDDSGNSSPEPAQRNPAQPASAWSGKDWVWPGIHAHT
jgi:hypothetical protein